jgi:hypothetical protein
MLVSRTNNTRRRRPRSVEDESPVIVGSIAILAVIVFSCVGMMAPVLWDAFTGGAGPHWGAQSCRQGTGAADAAQCPERAPLQAFQPQQKAQSTRLFRTYEIGSASLSNSYAFVSKLLTSGFSKESLECSR